MALPAQPNQSLIDGLACLGALAGSDQPVGSRDLARQLGLEPTRVNRLLKTLAHLGIAQQTPDRRYQPGPGMHVLSAQALHGSGLLRRALPTLASLHAHDFIVAMGVLWRDKACYLYHASPDMQPNMAIGSQAPYPASRSGIGLALLALEPDDAIRQRMGDRPEGFESIDSLLAAIARVRQDGYAVSQIGPGIRTIAVPLAGSGAAIALSGDIPDDDIPRLANVLRAAAAHIDQHPTEKP